MYFKNIFQKKINLFQSCILWKMWSTGIHYIHLVSHLILPGYAEPYAFFKALNFTIS